VATPINAPMTSPLIIGIAVALLAVVILAGTRRAMTRLHHRRIRRRRTLAQARATARAERLPKESAVSNGRLPGGEHGAFEGEALRRLPTGSD
jgi:hypothetical protein